MIENRIQLPEDKKLASQVLVAQNENERRKILMGKFGEYLGGGDEKSGNIAFIVLAGSFLALMVLLVLSALYPEAKLNEAMTGFFTVITTTIGYIFGRNTSDK